MLAVPCAIPNPVASGMRRIVPAALPSASTFKFRLTMPTEFGQVRRAVNAVGDPKTKVDGGETGCKAVGAPVTWAQGRVDRPATLRYLESPA